MSDAVLKPRRHRFLRTFAAILGGVLLIVLGWFLWQTTAFYLSIRNGEGTLADRKLQASISNLIANAQVTPQDLARLTPSTGLYPERGNRNAKVTVVEFVDYQCPFCQEAAPVVRRVMDAMGDRVRFIVRDFPIIELHPTAKQSALAANCVLAQGQELYWRYYDALFADIQRQSAGDLRVSAQAVGADVAAFDACVAQNRYGEKINSDIETALRVGVQGTPTFFVNGIKIQGALDEKTLTRVLNAVLERSN